MSDYWEFAGGALWWIHILFVYLVIVGIKSIKPRTIPIKRIIWLPLLLVTWSFYSLGTKNALGLSSLIPIWLIFLPVGTYWGARQVRAWKISKDRNKGKITIPGNYSTLALILLVFTLKFSWGYCYFYANLPKMSQLCECQIGDIFDGYTLTPISYWIYFWDTLTSSLSAGFFVGRAISYFRSYQISTVTSETHATT